MGDPAKNGKEVHVSDSNSIGNAVALTIPADGGESGHDYSM
jgi:hypothetical protein